MQNKTANDNNRIMAIVNQKGGVGKTTTAVNIATALAAAKKKVLLIDMDPQGNASTTFGIDNSQRKHKGTYEVMIGQVSINNAIIKTSIPNLSLITANVDLSAAELELTNFNQREFVLKGYFRELTNKFDFILIDCPPSLGLLTLNALVAAHSIVIPLQCEFFALEGLSHLFKTISLIKRNLNPDLLIHGVVLTMHDRRNKLTEQVEKDVREHLGGDVYQTVIPRNVKISEAPSHGKPAIIYDYKCAGSVAYIHLAKEILQKESALSA